ncbi:MAG: HAD family phosphatase [Vicingaceae bacterium]
MKNCSLEGIENIIFDLGMVIINLDKQATPKAFEKLCEEEYAATMDRLNQEKFFEAYETGKISTDDFVNRLKHEIGGNTSAIEVENAWNAMLNDIPERRFEILQESKAKYRTFCLSNTNDLHIRFIYQMLKEEKGIPNLDQYFEKVYLSHEMGQRKPDVEIFETVIVEQGLQAAKTLFIDDTAEHLEGARKAGLNTFHLVDGIVLEQLF